MGIKTNEVFSIIHKCIWETYPLLTGAHPSTRLLLLPNASVDSATWQSL